MFTVWAPLEEKLSLHLVHPQDKVIEMTKDGEGYFRAKVEGLPPGARYFFRPGGDKDYPDPASRYQPGGVHGPSQVVDHNAYRWNDQGWKGLRLEELIIYELHVGTFTPEGTFEAIIPRLDALAELGINALEIMPVAQFPGDRNWGYDGVYPYAVQASYGGPEGLKTLVDACHQRGIAVILDVVYNHVGPEGAYLSRFGPYFTDRYQTPWGDAINMDDAWSDGVRDFFSDNALYWFQYFHMDGLRCDAIHAVYDNGAVHFWELLYNKVKALEKSLGRPLHLVAESDLNSPKVVKTPEAGGYGFGAQWLDDFHHALYVLIDKKGRDRYIDFGTVEQLAKGYKEGFVHSGEWVKFRKRRHGASSAGIPGNQFIVFNLNHDQVGNRVDGARLCALVNNNRLKVAAAAILLAPYIPLLFMGEEYADQTPFYYFVSHSDPALIEAVRKGRKEEFKDYGFDVDPPDPQAVETFLDSKLHWKKRYHNEHRVILEWHGELIRLRKDLPVLRNWDKKDVKVEPLGENGFVLIRQTPDAAHRLVCLFNLSDDPIEYHFPLYIRRAYKILDSRDPRWVLEYGDDNILLPPEAEAKQHLSLLPQSVAVYYTG